MKTGSTNIKSCRDSMLCSAKSNEADQHELSHGFSEKQGLKGVGITLERYLQSINRVRLLRRKLGCVGMNDGICCLIDHIPLITESVVTLYSEREPQTNEPMPAADSDAVEETVELIAM